MFAREMQEHLKLKENRLSDAIFQIDVLKEQLVQNSKRKSFSSNSSTSSEISLNQSNNHSNNTSNNSNNRGEEQYYLLESELQMYKRQMSKQQTEKSQLLKNLQSQLMDLSISFSSLLSSIKSIFFNSSIYF